MEPNKAFEAMDALVYRKLGKHFSDQERDVFLNSWTGDTYEAIVDKLGRYTAGYLAKSVGPNLWKSLSDVLGEEVNKSNFRWAVIRYAKQSLTSEEYTKEPEEYSRRVATVLERGSTDAIDWIADAALFLADHRYEFREDLHRFVAAGQPVPMKYLYCTQAASQYWLRLCQQEAYSFYRRSLSSLMKVSCRIVDTIVQYSGSPEIDFISLGSGDGQKDLQLLLAFTSRLSDNQYIYYYPIDISDSMIVEAIRTATSAGIARSKLRLKAIIGDFWQLKKFQIIYESRPSTNVFSILGNSLGNADELQIIEALSNAIFPGDFVLIEVNIGEPEVMLINARDSINIQHDFTPLSALGVPFDPTLIDYAIEEGRSNIRGTKSLVATYREADLKGSTLRNINLSIIHHYQIDPLLDYLQRRVRLQILWHQCENEIALILAQRPQLEG